MKDKRTFVRALALVAALVVALLLLAGTYTAIASPAPDLSSASSSATTWSSGWVTIITGTSQVFTHNLGGDPNNYAVELWFLDTDDGWGINRRYYGGLEDSGN